MHFRSLVFNASTLTLCALLLSACSGDDKGLSVLFTCGNGQVESGEQCDPGGICDDGSRCIVGGVSTCPTRACLPADTAICSSICTRPECGDGLAQGGLEQCDGFDLRGATVPPS